MKLKLLLIYSILITAGCSSVPSIKLERSAFEQIKSVNLQSSPTDNSNLSVISTVSIAPTGVGSGVYASAGDGLGFGVVVTRYMADNDIYLNEIVLEQFKQKVSDAKLPIEFSNQSKHLLHIKLNVVVLGMVHGFSDEFNSRFNIEGQLTTEAGQVIWSYNAIPISPIASGYSLTAEELLVSPEKMRHFFIAASEPMVEKLFRHFAKDLL